MTASLNWRLKIVMLTSRNVVFHGKYQVRRSSSSRCWLIGLAVEQASCLNISSLGKFEKQLDHVWPCWMCHQLNNSGLLYIWCNILQSHMTTIINLQLAIWKHWSVIDHVDKDQQDNGQACVSQIKLQTIHHRQCVGKINTHKITSRTLPPCCSGFWAQFQ
jgi:hypothetical protein